MTTRKAAKPKKPDNLPGTSKRAARDREAMFVEAYLANGRNGAQAAVAAGFAKTAAKRQALRLLDRDSVRKAIEARQEVLAKKYELTTDGVIGELAKIVHADVRQLFDDDGSLKPISEWPDAISGAVASVEVVEEFAGTGAKRVQIGWVKKVKLWDKNPSIEKAMKFLGMFEKDNKQKTDPLREFLAALPGAVIGVVEEPAGDD